MGDETAFASISHVANTTFEVLGLIMNCQMFFQSCLSLLWSVADRTYMFGSKFMYENMDLQLTVCFKGFSAPVAVKLNIFDCVGLTVTFVYAET